MGRPALHFHLSHLHNVVPECVEKLLLVVSEGWGKMVLGSCQGRGGGSNIQASVLGAGCEENRILES